MPSFWSVLSEDLLECLMLVALLMVVVLARRLWIERRVGAARG